MTRTQRYLLGRIAQAVPSILGIMLFNFCLLHLAPGDVADVLAGMSEVANEQYMAHIRQQFGLDQPLYVQFFYYLKNLVQLDLGYSYIHSMPVFDLIMQRLPATLLLMASCLTVSITLGVLLGITAARFVNTPIDYISSVLALFCYSTPVFWAGLILIIFFSVHLGWFPSGGFETVTKDFTGLDRCIDVLKHLVLPTITYSMFYLAVYTRIMRSSMLEVYSLDFVRTAEAKGLSPFRIAFKHVLRNALLPIVTMVGLQFAGLLGGVVIIESVFGWPGLGRLLFEAVGQRDYNLVLSVLVISSVLVITINLIVDFVYAWLDPRIEIGK